MITNSNDDSLTPLELAELKRLIAGRREDILQRAECERLEQLLQSSSQARDIYIGYMQVESGIKWKIHGSNSIEDLRRLSRTDGGTPAVSESNGSPRGSRRHVTRRRLKYLTMAVAASVVLLLASTAWLKFDRHASENSSRSSIRQSADVNSSSAGDIIANIIELSDDSRWFVENQRIDHHGICAGETIRLTQGQLRLDFSCGANVTMKSPAALKVIAPKRTRAILGALKAHAGPGAEGFTVETPLTTVVDLGTDFGIDVSDRGSTDVVVFNGAVDVHSDGVRGLSPTQRLQAGEGLRVSGERSARRIVSITDSQFSVPEESSAALPRLPVISAVLDNIRRGESWHYYEIVQGGMREDAVAFADRDHEWNGVDKSGMPSYLIGGDYVKTFNDDKVNRNVEIRVTLDRPAALYILHDNRSPVPDWVRADYFDTGDEIGMDGTKFGRILWKATLGRGAGESIDATLSIWRRDVPAGTVKLGAIQIGGERHNMYGIVAVPLQLSDANDDFAGSPVAPSKNATRIKPSIKGDLAIDGAIERQGDVDAFSFNWAGGPVQVACHVSQHATLDPVLTVFDQNEMLIGYSAGSPSRSQDAAVTMNLPAGTYYAVVRGGDEVGEFGYYRLAIAGASAEIKPPAAPSHSLVLTADATSKGIKLSWNEVFGSSSYRVERSVDGITYAPLATAAETSLVDSSVASASTYIYRVRADFPAGFALSAPAKVQVLPAAVTDVQPFGLSPKSIAVSWRDVRGERSYRVERSKDGQHFETVGIAPSNANGFVDTSVEPDQRYHYRIVGVGELGDAPPSLAAAAVSGVGGLQVSGDKPPYVVKWNASSADAPLALQRADDCCQFMTIATFRTATTEFLDTTAPKGKKVHYRLVTLQEGDGLQETASGPIDKIQIPRIVDVDYYALSIQGKVKIDTPGQYEFRLESDDGSRLLMDGVVVIDNDGCHPLRGVSGKIYLEAGERNLEVQYFEFFGHSSMNLMWSGPGVKLGEVPPSAFSSLQYRYYKGNWSNLPFHKAIGKSQVVSTKIQRKKS